MNLSEKELKALRAEQERVEARDKRIAALPPALSETRSNAIILSDVKLQSQESARVVPQGPSLPEAASGPIHAVPSPKLDNPIAHCSRVQRDDVVGLFCGSPIVILDTLGVDVDVASDQSIRLQNSSGTSIPAEVMPGEEMCSDNIIRRITVDEHEKRINAVLSDVNLVDRKVRLLRKGEKWAVSTVHLRYNVESLMFPKEPRTDSRGVTRTIEYPPVVGCWESKPVGALNVGQLELPSSIDHIEYKEFADRGECELYFETQIRGMHVSSVEARQAADEGAMILWRPNDNDYALLLGDLQ